MLVGTRLSTNDLDPYGLGREARARPMAPPPPEGSQTNPSDPAEAEDTELLQEVFSLDEGPFTLTSPASLSAPSLKDLAAFFELFLRKMRRRAERPSTATLLDASIRLVVPAPGPQSANQNTPKTPPKSQPARRRAA